MSPNLIPLVLEWKPLASAQELLRPECSVPNCRCVYIWGFVLPVPTVGTQFVPYYVGRTKSFGERLTQHLGNLKGGRYKVYHQTILHEFHLHMHDAVSETAGKVHDPVSPRAAMQFNVGKALQSHADFMLEHFHFSYAPVPDGSIKLACVEGAVADSVKRGSQEGRKHLGTTKLARNDKYRVEHKGAAEVVAVLRG